MSGERETVAEQILIHNATVYGPVDVWRPGWLLVEGRVIRALGPGQPPPFPEGALARAVDAGGQHLLPGFVDPHVHGAVGHEVMDGDPEGLRAMARFYARHGVTAFLATTWTAPRETLETALSAVAQVVGPVANGASILGAYLEGPYLNPARCGAQDVTHIRRAEREEALALLESGLVRILALAPEFAENEWLIETCVRSGITVSAAHTTAGYAEMEKAVALGVRQVTHCFNAMEGLAHRAPGTVGAALTLPQITCELIADNIHVHPAAMKIVVETKGPAKVILVTDAIRGAGLAEGEYAIDERTVVVRDGAVRLPDGTLAGSILTMERALRNVQAATGRPLAELWPMSSLNAARALGAAAARGSLEAGKLADLVLLDEAYEVVLTMAEGAVVYERD